MTSKKQAEKQIVSSHDLAVSGDGVPNYTFEQWAGAVRQQMLAALKKRESNRGAWG